MATTPPPYTEITGIFTTDDKHQAVSKANYDGSARPGQLVVDTSDYSLYIGNADGALNAVGGGSLPLSNGDSSFNIPVASGNVEIVVDDSFFWIFDTTGNLNIPNNIIGASTIRIDNTATGNSADIQILSADDITLQGRDRTVESSSSEGGDINLYAGDGRPGIGDNSSGGGDIQIFGGIGGDAGNSDSASSGGFIAITSGNGGSASAVDNNLASSGGSLTLRAGDAGSADGVPVFGASGGSVTITAGNSTGNLTPGGDVTINTGTGGPNAVSGQLEINIPASDGGPGGIWSFDGDGIFTVASAIQLKRFDSTASRNTAIPAPTTGMMIYLDGVGLQVFGATQWNTVAGTDT